MVIVDWSHMSHRNLYVAISQTRPKKINGKYDTEEYISFYYHLMLNSLRLISHKFDAGEIVLAIDDKNYWRKDIFPDYKGSRKKKKEESDINFDEFYEKSNMFLNEVDEYFPYSVLNVKDCEADDIIGVLSKFYGNTERIVIVSSDKDMRQCIVDGAEMYDPMKKEFIRMSVEDAKAYKIQHILLGDSGDNIPNVFAGTAFTDNFTRYLKVNGIYVETPQEFEKLTISEKLYNEFDIYKVNRKGEIQDTKDIFKTVPFGEVKAKKAAEDLPQFFKKHPLLEKHYNKNAELVLFDNIPKNIQNDIITSYNDLTLKYEPTKIFNFLVKYNLRKLVMDITDFYIVNQREEKSKEAINEWM